METGRTMGLLAMLVATAQGGCSKDEEEPAGADAGETAPDAASEEPAIDAAPPLDTALVGSWIRTDAETGEVRDRYLFEADGAFRFDEETGSDNEDHIAGTWSASEGLLAMTAPDDEDPAQHEIEVSYHAGAGGFGFAALLPDGPHEGVVGTWRGSIRIERIPAEGEPEVSGGTIMLTCRSDGTMELRMTPIGDPPRVHQGTWSEEEPGVFDVQYSSGNVTVHHTLDLLDDDALSDTTYAREEAAAARAATASWTAELLPDIPSTRR